MWICGQGGEGVKKSENDADVIYGSPQMTSAINGRKDERQWKFRPEMRFFSLSSPFPKPISKLTCDTSQWPNFSRGGKTWGKFLGSRTRLAEKEKNLDNLVLRFGENLNCFICVSYGFVYVIRKPLVDGTCRSLHFFLQRFLFDMLWFTEISYIILVSFVAHWLVGGTTLLCWHHVS